MEIIIVLALALLVFGPKRLPEMGKTLGRAAREFRRASDEVKGVLALDLDDDPPSTPATPAASVAPAAAAASVVTVAASDAAPWQQSTGGTGVLEEAVWGTGAADTVPGLAGFLGVADPAQPADGDAAAPALAAFLGVKADESEPAAYQAPESAASEAPDSTAPGEAESAASAQREAAAPDTSEASVVLPAAEESETLAAAGSD